jgi:hypothetical protein
MEKPLTVKWINRILLFRLVVIIGIVVITTIVLLTNPEKGFWTGFTNTIVRNAGAPSPQENAYYAAGHVAGYYILPIILIFLEYIFLQSRKRIGFWIAFILDFMTIISYHYIPLLPIIVLVLYLKESTTNYLKAK